MPDAAYKGSERSLTRHTDTWLRVSEEEEEDVMMGMIEETLSASGYVHPRGKQLTHGHASQHKDTLSKITYLHVNT